MLVLPAYSWFVAFLILPLAIVLAYSFATHGPYGAVEWRWTAANYARVGDWLYLKIIARSLGLAACTAAGCLALGYPVAWTIATAPRRFKAPLLFLVVLPFWTNVVVRTYALKLVLPQSMDFLSAGNFAVWLGMLSNYLPFMILPLVASLENFDFGLLEAARDLGATPGQAIRRVLLPLTRRGIVSGLVFVAAPALGEFVIPDLLGGAKTMLIGNLITEQFLKSRDWPFGAALSICLLGFVAAALLMTHAGKEKP